MLLDALEGVDCEGLLMIVLLGRRVERQGSSLMLLAAVVGAQDVPY
jgi:hypothetical protein